MANKILAVGETEIVFGSEIGDDVAWSNESVTDGSGRNSALYDQGADSTARADRWRLRYFVQAQATPTLKGSSDLSIRTAEGASATHPTNDDGGDVALSSTDKLLNLDFVRSAWVDQAAANIEFVATATLTILARHFGFTSENNMGATVTTDPAESKVIATPYPREIA